MMSFPLAAIRFDRADVDAVLSQVAHTLGRQGVRVAGALQTRAAASADCHCRDMDLHCIRTGRVFRISQPLGNNARGCRLDPGALSDCAAHLEQQLGSGVDLLILNRWGRGESQGRGFRDLIGAALLADVPVLTALRPIYAKEWAEFGQDIAGDLPMTAAAVLDWFATLRRQPAARVVRASNLEYSNTLPIL